MSHRNVVLEAEIGFGTHLTDFLFYNARIALYLYYMQIQCFIQNNHLEQGSEWRTNIFSFIYALFNSDKDQGQLIEIYIIRYVKILKQRG